MTPMDDLVEQIRVVAYEKNYGSHSAWAQAVKSLFVEVCAGCGLNPDQDHTDIVHEDGTAEYQPMIYLRSLGHIHSNDNPIVCAYKHALGHLLSPDQIVLPRALFKNVDKWGHVSGSPYHGGCGVNLRDTNPPCDCGLAELRKALRP